MTTSSFLLTHCGAIMTGHAGTAARHDGSGIRVIDGVIHEIGMLCSPCPASA